MLFLPLLFQETNVWASAVFPCEHFFGNDVGFFADAAGEEGCVFKDGGADFAEVVAGEDIAGGCLNAVP